MKPSKENIAVWCAALRSGKYQQTKRALQGPYGHCCLGVACDVFIPPSQQERERGVDGFSIFVGGMPDDQPYAPIWLKQFPQIFFKDMETELTALNDGAGTVGWETYSFDEIADILEALYILDVLN